MTLFRFNLILLTTNTILKPLSKKINGLIKSLDTSETIFS